MSEIQLFYTSFGRGTKHHINIVVLKKSQFQGFGFNIPAHIF